MQSTLFTVKSSTQTKSGNFCNKLVSKSINRKNTDFGTVEQERQTTVYLFTKQQNEIGSKGNLILEQFDIVEKPFTFTSEDGDITTATLKYLYPKR